MSKNTNQPSKTRNMKLKLKMDKKEFIKELEEVVSHLEEDGMYALPGLKDKVDKVKTQINWKNTREAIAFFILGAVVALLVIYAV